MKQIKEKPIKEFDLGKFEINIKIRFYVKPEKLKK